MKRTLTLAGITLLALPLAAYARDNDDRGGRHRGGEQINNMEIYDTNADGSVTQEEVDAVRASRLAEFDTNGDGNLDLAEYEALWLDAYKSRMVDTFQRHDDDGDGIVTADEFGKAQARMIERMDRNGDGVLNADDRQRRQARKEK